MRQERMNTGSVPGWSKWLIAANRSTGFLEPTDRARGLGAGSPGSLCHAARWGAMRRARRVGLLLALAMLPALAANADVRIAAEAARPAADLVVTMIATPLN